METIKQQTSNTWIQSPQIDCQQERAFQTTKLNHRNRITFVNSLHLYSILTAEQMLKQEVCDLH